MPKVKILNKTLDLNIFNAKTARKIVEEHKKAGKKLDELGKTEYKYLYKNIEDVCDVIFNCFDNVFFKGASKKIFGDETDLLKCLKALEDLEIAITETQFKYLEKFKLNNKNKKT